jgi:hypothetical protein
MKSVRFRIVPSIKFGSTSRLDRYTEFHSNSDIFLKWIVSELSEAINTFKKQGFGSGFNHVSRSGSRRIKMTHKNRKKLRNFMF